jgi:hypothetical protein
MGFNGSTYRNMLLVAVAMTLSLVAPASAFADTPPPSPEPEPGSYTGEGFSVDSNPPGFAIQAVPPPCVTAQLDQPGIVTRTVNVTNSCATQQRVQVQARFQPDSPCFIIAPLGRVSYAMDISFTADPFDGLLAC